VLQGKGDQDKGDQGKAVQEAQEVRTVVAADKDAVAKAAVAVKVAAASPAEAAEAAVAADSKVAVEVLGAAALAVLEWVEAWEAAAWVVAALAVHGEAVPRSTDVRCHIAIQFQPRDANEFAKAALYVALHRARGWS
jgi:hypothetical protein